MTISPTLLYLWGALFLAFTALLVYRGTLTRYEDDQLFLDDEGSIKVQQNRANHEELVRKIARLKPLIGTCAVAAGLVTTTVVGMYVYNSWQNIP